MLAHGAPRAPRRPGMKNLCLAGGVALNCVANGRLLREGPFEDIWIQPAAGDAGGALGAALFVWHQLLGQAAQPRSRPTASTARCSGPALQRRRDRARSSTRAGAATTTSPTTTTLCDASPSCSATEKVVGWFQGRMEFGPRALGRRSILGDARSAEDAVGDEPEDQVPRVVPALRAVRAAGARRRVLRDARRTSESPYMLLVAPVQPDKRAGRRRRGTTASRASTS